MEEFFLTVTDDISMSAVLSAYWAQRVASHYLSDVFDINTNLNKKLSN